MRRTIRYVYGLDGSYLHRHQGSKKTDYIRAGGLVIARIQNDRITYPHHDHLGSPLRETGSAGNGRWSEAYTPYGSQRGASSSWNDDQPSFTGHIEDRDTGLTYMQARYYDPVAMRFLAPDPVQFTPGATAYFNRYAYAANDPLNNFDPDGRACVGANAWSSYCRRSALYQRFDAKFSGSTRFFAAASMTTTYLANMSMPGAQFVVSGSTRRFMGALSGQLEALNVSTAKALEALRRRQLEQLLLRLVIQRRPLLKALLKWPRGRRPGR